MSERTIAAVATPPGEGSVGVIRISGEKAVEIADSVFFAVSGKPRIGVLDQMVFDDEERTLKDEIRSAYTDILEMKKRLAAAQKKMENEQTDENIREYVIRCGFYIKKAHFPQSRASLQSARF